MYYYLKNRFGEAIIKDIYPRHADTEYGWFVGTFVRVTKNIDWNNTADGTKVAFESLKEISPYDAEIFLKEIL